MLGRFASCCGGQEVPRPAGPLGGRCRAAPERKASPAEIARRLKSWARADGRRAQCATWARRAGAPEHIGEGSPLAQLAAQGKAVPCEAFARKIDEDGWVPAALVDARID